MRTEIATFKDASPKSWPQEKTVISCASVADREQIYRLRHEVFARELQQYPENPDATLHDVLDSGNRYIVAKVRGKLVGFVSITPPAVGHYSIDKYFQRAALPFAVKDDLYEVRLLTVLKEYRGTDAAMLLMYAAFRWVEAHGGGQIVAIGRHEILDLYLKAGLQASGMTTSCGRVHYHLLYATVPQVRDHVAQYRGLLARVESRIDWQFNFPFYKPPTCFHGGAFFQAIGDRFDNLERRQTIINADVLDAWFDPSPMVPSVVRDSIEWLAKTSPPTGCEGLIEKIAHCRGVKPNNILPGAGSSDLIFRALPHWLTKDSHVLILDPTYGEYAHVLEKVIGATVDRLVLQRQDNYHVDLERLENAASDGYELIVLVNPNSPTGQHISRAKLQSVLSGIPSKTRVWIDETYIDYVGRDQSMEPFAAQSENVIVCKSMSKVYALSGMRVAYLCAGPHQLEELRAITPPWVVSLVAQVAATYALEDEAYYAKRYAETHTLRTDLAEQLDRLGWSVIPGAANFLLAHLPENGCSAESLITKCRKHGLFLRNGATMGSQMGDRAVRIAVKDAETNSKMLRIIENDQKALGAYRSATAARASNTFCVGT
jgi:histidinol-phosphate/aromatic aminotransferase/cobyric acid decarboxylase-like protein/GNAT superfamily N-acetyltransferase